MDEVVLARHGETRTSAGGRVGGDAPLTDAGRAQARELGQRLASFPVELCLTSRARRARETAELALAGRVVPFEELAELADIDFGSFAGRPLAEYREWIASHPPTESPGDGESRLATLRRFASAFGLVLDRPERHVLVVGHGLTLRAATEERPEPAVTGVPYGSAVRLTRAELERAVVRLDAWCEDPAW
ncbi:MAG: histidine phosphatase family protein [Gaiellaceae bacterium]